MTVLLRAPVEADIQAHLEAPPSQEIALMFGAAIPVPASPERSRAWFDWLTGHEFGRIIESEARAVGEVRLHSIDTESRSARLAVGLFREDDLGQGIGRKAVRLALKHGFSEMGLHRIDLRVLAINKRAIACYLACGFQHEGRLREVVHVAGAWQDDCVMSVLQHEYQEATS